MQKIIFLADLHGNMTATYAMEKEIERHKVDEIWFLGDAIGKGPENDKTCDWVRSHCTHFVGGNWEYELCKKKNEYVYDEFYWNQLGEERFTWLANLPMEDSVWISGIHFRLIHGRPVDQLYFGFDSDEKLSSGITVDNGDKTYGGLICADSHMSFIRAVRNGYVCNTGSVGNSLVIPKAYALLIEGELGSRKPAPITMTILSVPYDNEKAAAIAEDYPGFPCKEAYQKEVMTGIYARFYQTR